jgi:hypothetical protein
MKSSILMLVAITVFVAVWCTFAGLLCFLYPNTFFRDNLVSGGAAFFMTVLGWIPSLFVCIDLEKILK